MISNNFGFLINIFTTVEVVRYYGVGRMPGQFWEPFAMKKMGV
jgi:hypothetical protein